jgi:PPE-repeat protein
MTDRAKRVYDAGIALMQLTEQVGTLLDCMAMLVGIGPDGAEGYDLADQYAVWHASHAIQMEGFMTDAEYAAYQRAFEMTVPAAEAATDLASCKVAGHA